MSIHHEVTIHCDSCGFWEHGNQNTTRQRRKAGWLIWQSRAFGGSARWQHLCPECNRAGRATADGERP